MKQALSPYRAHAGLGPAAALGALTVPAGAGWAQSSTSAARRVLSVRALEQ